MKKLWIIALLLGFGAVMVGVGMRINSSSIDAENFYFPQSADELALTTNEQYYGRCHNYRIDDSSYEWIYAHLSEDDQELVDQKYIELLLEIDLEAMSDQERLNAIDDLKEALVTFIEDSNFEIGYWR